MRYAETDPMGYLYYGNYAQLYEIGRAELIRELGISYKEMEDIHRVMLPVVSLECRYKWPALYDEYLNIKTYLREMPTKMISFQHEILDDSGKLLNEGVVKLFFVDMNTSKRISCPDFLNERIKVYF